MDENQISAPRKEKNIELEPLTIEKVELLLVRLPLLSPFETSFGRSSSKEAIIVKLHSEGDVAYGECTSEPEPFYSYEFNAMSWKVLSEFIIPSLKGVELGSPRDFSKAAGRIRGHSMSKGCVEMAIWDLFARRARIPLSQMIGGARKRIECGISIGIQKSVSDLLNVIDDSIKKGYRRIKVKVKPGWDVDVLRAIRRMYPELPLQVDANAAYELKSMDHLKKFDRFNLTMLEQPLDYDDLFEHSILQAGLETPICLDESIKGPESVNVMSRLESGRIVNIKAGRVGGIGASLAVHDTAMKNGIPVWIGGMLETGVGRSFNVALNTLPNVRFPGDTSPSSRYFSRDIITEPFEMDASGRMNVPSGYGSGIEIDEKQIRRITVRSKVVKLN
ncbi:MAG: o-succinylbenzoate synthase [Candidatus Thermoplasmatota archaeon]|nr:o-succinylbenzoate synthase [Candidatus Thermoplasmatota archaeon]MCL5252807.1 o-succinylbenzoate synthase [Candidatus Thermoplasmatota archaeon]